MKQALIIGMHSTIGFALYRELMTAGWTVYGTTRRDDKLNDNIYHLDMADVSAFKFTRSLDVVYLCAGMTKITDCEQDPSYARRINVEATIQLAHSFLQQGIHVIYLSSNAVFDGKHAKYRTTDRQNPTTLYGEYKACVENELLRFDKLVTIVRLTKVLTPDYALMVQWIDRLNRREVIKPFHDLNVSPISVNMVTRCLQQIAQQKLSGIIHLSGSDDVSYAELAHYLACMLGADNQLIQPISSANSSYLPFYTSLDMTETNTRLNLEAISFAAVMRELYSS